MEATKRKNTFEEYCASTSIHGVQYIGERGLPLWDRLCWFLLLTVGFLVSGSLIINEFYKWKNSKVITAYNDTSTPVWEIPFPSVTICTENKYRKNMSDIFMKKESEVRGDEHELEILEAAMVTTAYWEQKKISEFRNESFLDTMKMVAPSLDAVIQECVWKGHGLKSCKIYNAFKPIFTDVGICFAFNSLDPRETYNLDIYFSNFGVSYEKSNWRLEHGYTSSNFSDSYPYRGAGSLEIFLLGKNNVIDDWTRNPYEGFEIFINNPAEIPQYSDKFIPVPPSSDVIVSVTPEVIVASDDIRKSYKPEQRHCYYPSEHPLHFFKTYVQKNCKLECLTNFTLELCKCVHFNMPRKPGTSICGSSKTMCVFNARELLEKETIEKGDLCNCLPDCNSLRYNFQVNQVDTNWIGLLKMLNEDFKLEGDYLSFVKIILHNDKFISKYRKETYVSTDFLANCGGFLGLFSGFSIISLVEIMYHLIVRFWRKTNIQRSERNENDTVFHLT